jgi:hypothetical protein
VETELFPNDSILELNTKNLGNSSSFLTIIHTTMSACRFRSYGILTVDVAAEFCIGTEQRHNGSSISSLILVETPDVLNIVLEDNSLSFMMLY